jgi:predicted transcriptional regulator YdeE
MMESFIGMDYERGLRMLKELIETGSIQLQTIVKGVVPADPLTMLGVSDKCRVAEVGSSMDAAFKQATQLFQQYHLSTDGGMISVYRCFDMKVGTFSYISGYVVPESTKSLSDVLTKWMLPAGNAFCVEHIGSSNHFGNAWNVANQIARYKKLKQSKVGTFELYRTTPPDTPDAELRTEIYLPLRW